MCVRTGHLIDFQGIIKTGTGPTSSAVPVNASCSSSNGDNAFHAPRGGNRNCFRASGIPHNPLRCAVATRVGIVQVWSASCSQESIRAFKKPFLNGFEGAAGGRRSFVVRFGRLDRHFVVVPGVPIKPLHSGGPVQNKARARYPAANSSEGKGLGLNQPASVSQRRLLRRHRVLPLSAELAE